MPPGVVADKVINIFVLFIGQETGKPIKDTKIFDGFHGKSTQRKAISLCFWRGQRGSLAGFRLEASHQFGHLSFGQQLDRLEWGRIIHRLDK
jgi:hypothetical protein